MEIPLRQDAKTFELELYLMWNKVNYYALILGNGTSPSKVRLRSECPQSNRSFAVRASLVCIRLRSKKWVAGKPGIWANIVVEAQCRRKSGRFI